MKTLKLQLKKALKLANTQVLAIAILTSTNLSAQNWNEVIKAVASDRATNDKFGVSVSISGNYAIVGANAEDEDAAGGNTLSDAGSAYIFERDASGNWSQVQKITASDRGENDWFGVSVAISGNYAIVGAATEDEDTSGGNTLGSAGSAYIFERDASGNWNQVQKITASDRGAFDYFGYSVSISGNYAIVGASLEDHDAAGGNFLSSAGSAYIFEREASGNWIQVRKILASDRSADDFFGNSVSISGNYAIVGAYWEDEDASGGNTLTNAGSAYIFERDASGNWNQVQKITASDREAYDYFAYSVSISGNHAIMGAYQEGEDASGGNTVTNAGSAYVFERDASGNWNQVQKITASDRGEDDVFGFSVSISGTNAIVGAYQEDEDASGGNFLSIAGSAYIFEQDASSGNWNQVQKIVASDRLQGDRFGVSVSISGNYAIAGASTEDHDAGGGNFLSNAGSAYVFEPCLPTASSFSVRACDSYTVPSGDETYITSQTVMDTIPNVAGCDSVMTITVTINNSNTGTDVQTACDSYTWIDGNTYTASTDTPTYTLSNAGGCDSVVTLNLTINSVDTSVTNNAPTLIANATGASYQWLDCNNNFTPIAGETQQSFTATSNGSYAVEISENGCVDTSACYTIVNVGIVENDFGNSLLIYPNPSDGNFSIDLGKTYSGIKITIADVLGRQLQNTTFSQTQQLHLTFTEPAGVYLITVETATEKAVIKLVKE